MRNSAWPVAKKYALLTIEEGGIRQTPPLFGFQIVQTPPPWGWGGMPDTPV
jgi:hypothetical protein